MMYPKEARVRSKPHLGYVASKPCCLCKNIPSQAHHLTHAQPKGRGIRAGDNWTVPLCYNHHSELHNLGDEHLFWVLYQEDPFVLAKELWNEFQHSDVPL